MSTVTLIGIASALFVVAFTVRAYAQPHDGRGQSRRQSIIEAWVNIGIGFTINFVANLLILPLVGLHIGLADNFWIGWIYTAISIIRQYLVRRYFNRLLILAK